ncbi:M23 family metallopeptidase [Paenibacillus yanchengensis]|uniref:M23 family metallopeptidase n=1 Tax=Paenibacillus yanchengensis TaxID=2035833 RepID=A0ABW4YFN2_9BACL
MIPLKQSKVLLTLLLLTSFLFANNDRVTATSLTYNNTNQQVKTTTPLSISDEKKQLYEQLEAVTLLPWYWLAAIDQYERSLTKVMPKIRQATGQISAIFIDESRWAGPLNPNQQDEQILSIQWFGGIGKDGDGDGLAKRTSDLDLLYTVSSHITSFGLHEDQLANGLWHYYKNSRSVQRVQQFAAIYRQFGHLDLQERAFPLPTNAVYSYKNTWGLNRSWGGKRTHEGTDLFARNGTPVRSTAYGIVEIKGWNRYGGWRVGIRDLDGFYHYFAHLSGFEKSLNKGDIVKPGQIIGWVGSSGYGNPGTQGKFPPHLHYGIYSDRGSAEWSFDPYPLLRKWEQADKQKRINN